MPSLLVARLLGYGAAVLAVVGVVFWFGAHERGIGAAGVQAKWDAFKAAQAQVVAKQEASNAARYQSLTEKFNHVESQYEASNAIPSVAPSVAASVRDGSLRLRDSTDSCPGLVSVATARSRAADAASTQALADRIHAAIAAVRAGDAADAREHKLDAQVIALQSILRAERAHEVNP